ncbi:adaptin ear-binding coat-associated protein 1 NECAP-1 [Wolfiporia cocos MD-104 SS10]|uniref:Adaptin ear-binding coat-associated protein 1 NECAP-1 n=1 Tax=Wolfiporia cocos (strain MD-104) TaxID=742152 RepID=A0A2H3JD30_WOLCO|nr:adaptin ear-binding coat-associated protein 1 NECAP-1 [Wolfiporia cocos MD-104 SS10]
MEEFREDEIESVLYIGREVSVYKIPPLKKNEGHRAQEWGDLGNPLWKGRLRIIERSNGVAIQFEDATTGELFAKADYDPAKPCVEAVLDSSRYFVVRVEDNGKRAYIGMGFLERTDSFDFNVTLQDYTKRWKARMNPQDETTSSPSPHVPAGPKKDYSLKEGQTFSISIPGRPKATSSTTTNLLGSGSTSSSSSSGGLAFPLLPPPPSAPKRS